MTKTYEKIKRDLIVARKEKAFIKGELILLVSDIDARTKDAKLETPKDELVFAAVGKAIKNIDDQLETVRTTDLKESLLGVQNALKEYLPQQVTGTELANLIKATIGKNPDFKMGQVIGAIKKEQGASVDGKELSQLVKGFF